MSTADLVVTKAFRGNIPTAGAEEFTVMVEVHATSPRGKAFLRMWVDKDDAPTPDRCGGTFGQLMWPDFVEFARRAQLAGLAMERRVAFTRG